MIRHSHVVEPGDSLDIARIGHGQPLVLLHGWPEFWFTCELVTHRLAKHFDVVAPDQRGFGTVLSPSERLEFHGMPRTLPLSLTNSVYSGSVWCLTMLG